MAIVHCDFNETWYSIAFVRVGLDFMSRNVALAARKNQVTSFNFSPCHILQVAFYNFQVVSWYQFTTNCGYTDLAQACLNFIKWASIWNTSCQSLLHTSTVILFAFQVEFHSGVLLDRLAAPWAGLFTSHPGVQWSRHSGWISRVIMKQKHPTKMFLGRGDRVPCCRKMVVRSQGGDGQGGWGG